MAVNETEKKDFIPFFLIVIFVIVFLYIITITTDQFYLDSRRLLMFTTGMLIHLLLHGIFWNYSERTAVLIVYFAVQSILAGVLIIISGNTWLLYGLYLAVLGEEIGIFRGLKRSTAIVFINLALIAATYMIKNKTLHIDLFAVLGTLPMILFVIIYVNLYSRQYDAKMEARNLLEKLERTNIKLTESKGRIEELTRENERQRIARELHDTLAQGLSGIILQLEAATAHLHKGKGDKAEVIIRKSMEKARETLAEARDVIDNLRNDAGRIVPLIDYIHAEIDAIRKRSAINYKTDINGTVSISSEKARHLMKIISEALGNCAEHSAAENALLILSEKNGTIRLDISDDGCGFDPGEVGPGHYGLIGIRERCQILGGEVEIVSSPGNGTNLSVHIRGECSECE